VALFELARSREDDWPTERTVGVGDTPLDVSSAHAAGAMSIAVTTGAYDAEQLRDADTVISSLAELPAALAALV
jgi:phosphoglycolate phosphatase